MKKTCLIPFLAFMALAQVAANERFLMYQVERITPEEAPEIDGKLDEPVWRGRPAIDSLRNFHGSLKGEFASQKSEIVLLTDGVSLFLGATFHDDEMAKIRFNPAAAPFWNDCIELYFAPRGGEGIRFIQLVVDCGGRRWWHKIFDDGYGWWDDHGWYMLADWQAAVWRGEDRWTVEAAINLASFGIDPAPGKTVGFNPCRFRLGAAQREFSAWGMGPGGAGGQKDMSAWGHLIFARPGERGQGTAATREDVALVYPELGDRVIEAPANGGMTVFTRDGTRTVSFRDLLAPTLEQALADLAGAEAQLAQLPADYRLRKSLAKLFQDAATPLAQMKEEIADGELTIGRYDKLADDLRKAAEQAAEIHWRTRVAGLVFAANPGG